MTLSGLPRPKFQIGDVVVIRKSHFLEDVRGRTGIVAMPPSDVATQLMAHVEPRKRPDGIDENFYWIIFPDAEEPGDVDAGMIPESDLEKS